MKKSLYVLVALLFFVRMNTLAQSSAIPDKRNFPLDQQVNPCDDYHAYVCSTAEKSFKLREDRSAHTFSFDDSEERILEKKKDFFKNIDKETHLAPRSEQMRAYYQACMNEQKSAEEERWLVTGLKRDIASIKTIKDYIDYNLANMTNEKWSFLSYEITPNINQPKIYDITFDVGYMFLPEHSYYEDKDLLKAYAGLISEFYNTIYPDENKEEHLKRAQAVVEFERRFKETYPKPADFRKRYTEPRYVARSEFLNQTQIFGLDRFFKKVVPEKTKIRNFIPESFAFAANEVNEKNLAVLKDMLIFRSAREFMDDAYPDLYKKRMEFSHKYLGGAPTRPERQERCTHSVMGAFGRELDQEMLPRLFPDFPEKKVRDVAVQIRKSILDGLQKNTWLSVKAKKSAIEKIKTAKLQIIQPRTDEEWDFKPIRKYNPEKPYENARQLALLSHERQKERLRKGVNQEAWGMGPLTVNAYYSPDKNKFVMPIGILQYPFFVSEGDLIDNLGAVGAVMGHELGHAIDDEGSKFNAAGQLKAWMSEADLKNFKERGQKLVEQFNKIGHNGELTLGENVADLVGLTFSYHAAFDGKKPTQEEQKRFFTSFARLWCGVVREKTKEMWLKTDPHSLGSARVNEQVKHQPGFQSAYNCHKDNKLYLGPENQITIW